MSTTKELIAEARQRRRDSLDLQAINRIVADQTKALREKLAKTETALEAAQRDSERLDWLLANMHLKGFDDLACGVCSRTDIDAAMQAQQPAKAESKAEGLP